MAIKIYHDFPDKPDDQLSKLKSMRNEGIRWRDQWGTLWDRNVATTRGELWPDKSSKPLFLTNLISPTVRRKAGLLAESKPGIDIKPRKDGLGIAADVLRKTTTAIWDEQNASMALETISYYLANFGNGYMKITYDPTAEFGEGSIIIADVDSRLMIIDPSIRRAVDLWKSGYIIEESVMPLSWVKRNYPKTSKDLQADSRITYEPGNDAHKIGWYGRLREQMKKLASGGENAIDRVFLQQYWVADATEDSSGKLIYPGGRRIWVANDDVILNPSDDPDDLKYGQNNPYWDGMPPYVMIDNEPDMDHPFGHAEVEALRKMNEAFNAVGHMTTRTMIKNVPWIIADAGSIDAATLQDLKELEEVVIEKTPGRSVERNPPTQPTATNLDFMRSMITWIEMYAGLNDGALQGKGRVELRSAPQLEGLQQAAQVLIRAQARRLENMIERAGQLLISRIFQFYTDDRIMVYTDTGTIKQFDFQKEALRGEIIKLAKAASDAKALKETQDNLEDGQSLQKAYVEPEFEADDILEHMHGAWKLFRFKVIPWSTLASTKLQRAAALQELAQQGYVPGSMVVREAGFDNPKELQQEAINEIKERTAIGFPPPGEQGGKKKKK